jgi:hypothetical protein
VGYVTAAAAVVVVAVAAACNPAAAIMATHTSIELLSYPPSFPLPRNTPQKLSETL